MEYSLEDGAEAFVRTGVDMVAASVNTLYRRKGVKVRHVDKRSNDGAVPGGERDWLKKCLEKYHDEVDEMESEKFRKWLRKRVASFSIGPRLTKERLNNLKVGGELLEEERELLFELLYLREGALGWGMEDIGTVRQEVTPPLRLDVVEHKAWQEKGYRVPKALESEVVEMLKDRMEAGALERCQGPYRNPWFLVPKKNKKY